MAVVVEGWRWRRPALLGVIFAACVGAFGKGYAIQAGAYVSAAEAQVTAQQLMADWAPVRVEQVEDRSGYPYKVRVGYFPVYAEAWAAKSLIGPAGPVGAFIVALPNQAAALESNRLGVVTPFDTTGLDQPEPADASVYWEAAGLRGQNSDFGGEETIEQLESELALQPTGSSANEVRLRLARKHSRAGNDSRTKDLLGQVRNAGMRPELVMADFVEGHAALRRSDRGAALEKFKAVANNGAAPPSVRREAMRRAAGVLHKQRAYPSAWMAFGQLAENTTDPTEEAEARMQQAGLAFELAGREKGSWGDVRALCQVVFENPQAPHEVRATAELMFLETFWMEGLPGETLARAQSFLERYFDVAREAVMARLWVALAQHSLGDNSGARTSFELAAEEAVHAADKFAGVEPRAYAAGWAAYLAHLQGDAAARDQWQAVVETEFPNSPEAARLRALLGQ